MFIYQRNYKPFGCKNTPVVAVVIQQNPAAVLEITKQHKESITVANPESKDQIIPNSNLVTQRILNRGNPVAAPKSRVKSTPKSRKPCRSPKSRDP